MTEQELHGIYYELNFWKGFVKTERFLNGWVKPVKTPELNDFVADFILKHNHQSVLDVGSGVVSILNGLVPVTAVDPLGDLYRLIFDYQKHGIEPPKAIPAEELTYNEQFDIVHCSNALDHVQNVYAAYHNMYNAVKPGGYLIIQGFENEADAEKHKGFHQNNIFVDKNRLVTDRYVYGVIDENPLHTSFIDFENKRWFIWIVQK